jgi:hypothetical protein
MEILGEIECSGLKDSWREYLCLERLPDGGVELSSRSYELLGYEDWWAGEVVWPDGYGPDAHKDEENADDADEDVLPLSVGGKPVMGRDGNPLR